jgi:hypothetical protein
MKKIIVLNSVIVLAMLIIASCSKNTTEPEQQNKAPLITSIVPSPYSVPMKGIITLTCLAADPDGDQLSYNWEALEGTITGSGPSVEWTAPEQEGSFSISCKVSDGNGGEANQNVDVAVSGSFNNAPQISTVYSSADSAIVGEMVTIHCDATDADGDPLTYDWQASGGTIQPNGNSADWTAPDTTGSYQITVTVTDGRGGEARQTSTLRAVEAPIPTEGLLGFYPFEGSAQDESGNSYHGVTMGGASASDGILDIRNNATDRVYLPNDMADGLTDFTMAAWLKIDVVHVSYLNTVFSGASSATHNAFSFWYSRENNNNKTWRIVLSGPGYSFETNDVIEDYDWHHVAVKRDGAFAYLYIDGAQVGARISVNADPVAVAPDGLFLGQEQDAIGGSFDQRQSWAGEMDNVRFYSRSLSADEIRRLYEEPHSD